MLTLHLFRCSRLFSRYKMEEVIKQTPQQIKNCCCSAIFSIIIAKLHDPTYAWTPWWPHPEQKWWVKRKYKTKNILNIIAGHVGISQINCSCRLILGVLILNFKMSLYDSDIHIQQRVTSFLFNSKSIKKNKEIIISFGVILVPFDTIPGIPP